MKEEIIQTLPSSLIGHMKSLKTLSYDDIHKCYLTDSNVTAIDFDKIPREYCKAITKTQMPCSNDALYVQDKNHWFFFEFKNGNIDATQIYRKIYDSIIMLLEMNVIPNIDFSRKHIEYYLVYNQRKTMEPAREKIYAQLYEQANKEKKLFGLDKLKGYILRNTHTYTKEQFDIFIKKVEEKEG